ncbi:hypothetical protein GYA19_01765, partial [Candidatus Beckwithbacteria bacterium]|nr:hypothetical protein [Candidatus Beckwithbacteria bacterium]
MAFNNLLNLGKNKQNQTEAFLALEINEDYVKAAVWMVQEGQIKVIKTSEIVAIENENIESLLQSVDMAIATACQDVSFNPEKTIFGIMHDWVDQEGIVPDKKEILKYLSQKLELKPIGYVILEEALVTYLQKQQSTPPTAILIRFSQSELLLTLVELGNIVLQEKVGRSEDLVSDVNEGLKRFADADPLPSRIILYNCNTNFEEIKQRLLAFDWEKDLPFLHTPKIESLEMKQSIKAVAIAGGSEVAKSMGFAIEEEKPVEQTNEPAEEVKTQEQLPEGFVVGQQLDLEKEETKAEELESLIVTTQNEAVISSKQPNKTGIMLAKFKAFLSK